MADIRKLYKELLTDLYPYTEIDFNIPDSGMLYNLIEIKKDIEKSGDMTDNELIKDINRINTLIDIFQVLGIKASFEV